MRKSRKFIINSLLLATFLGTASIPLTSCSSTNTTTQNSNKNNNGSTKESSNNNSTNGNGGNKQSESTSTNSIESTIFSTKNYIIKHYTEADKNVYSNTYPYKITSRNYQGYPTEVYAYATDENESNPHFSIKVNANISGIYLSICMDFYESNLNDGYINSCVQMLADEPTKCYATNPYNNVLFTDQMLEVKTDFSNTSKILLNDYANFFDNYKVAKSTTETNVAVLIDFGLSYTSAFLDLFNCDIKDLGFINY